MSAYQVIARKWRPQTFDDIVGQDHVVRTLKNAIARGRIAHAYLFVGPRGTGKTSTARIFAKALNCAGRAAGRLRPRRSGGARRSPTAPISTSSRSTAPPTTASSRCATCARRCRYAPAQGKFKIYIIDEVHMLSAAAFNALLKTLEEPPPHVKFVFATTDVQKVLPTILSRCQRFDLKPIPPNLIVGRLRQIAAAEKIQVADGALACIARLADGGMRDAQSILDQMISFCGSDIAEADVLDVYGLVAAEKVARAGRRPGGRRRPPDHRARRRVRRERARPGPPAGGPAGARAPGAAGRDRAGREERRQSGGAPLTTEQLTRLLDGLREGEGGGEAGPGREDQFRGDAPEGGRGQPGAGDRHADQGAGGPGGAGDRRCRGPGGRRIRGSRRGTKKKRPDRPA